MRCPICRKGMDEQDELFVCPGCGAEFGLEYLGCYPNEGDSERIDEGFEPEEWKERYGERLREWKRAQ